MMWVLKSSFSLYEKETDIMQIQSSTDGRSLVLSRWTNRRIVGREVERRDEWTAGKWTNIQEVGRLGRRTK